MKTEKFGSETLRENCKAKAGRNAPVDTISPPHSLQGRWLKVGSGALATLFLPTMAPAAQGAEAQGLAPVSGFVESLVIFLREGAEAILVIAALWAVLVAMRAPARAFQALRAGALAGVAGSLFAGVTLASSLAATGAVRELVEGLALVLAAAVLLFVSSWLLGQREARQWKDRLRRETLAAFSGGGLSALFFVGFLAVFREGAETALFILAALAGGGGQSMGIVAGAAVAALILGVAFYVVKTLGLRLPLRAFFTVSAWALLALAVIYAGRGVHALQEAGWMTETPTGSWPRVGILGLYPYTETLLAQAATLLGGLLLNLRSWLRHVENPDPAE